MTSHTFIELSDSLAGAIAAVEASVVQVHGRRRPVSGVAYSANSVLTTTRALGREDGVRVTTSSGQTAAAELAGWDPASGLALLRVPDLTLTPAVAADAAPRVGQIAIGVGRSWSNGLTASAGIVAIVGGPLRTGRGQTLEQVIRVTTPMHDGFAGGAIIGADGRVIGIATAAQIRGFTVVVPSAIAWKSGAHVLEHGRPRMGFLGVSAQPVGLPEGQRGEKGRDRGLVVLAVTPGGPAATAGVLVGDIILELDGHAVASTDELLKALAGDRVGRLVPLRILRGGAEQEISVTVGDRAAS
jgi:S1-C subfamily serine protease